MKVVQKRRDNRAAGDIGGANVAGAEPSSQMAYPQTRRVDHTDDYFGVKVADPYRWLEDDIRASPEVADVGGRRKQGHRPLPGVDPAAGENPPPADRALELHPVSAAPTRKAAATIT